MTNPKDLIPLAQLESEILELLYNNGDEQMTTSDLQGVVQAIILNAYILGQKRVNAEIQETIDSYKVAK